ncbi:hypothetical protein NWI01_32120 [Nitrobacter winogradskyi]|uniref:Uncharacterized protein n=1 Tax=Nitrobacter winogradskyi TaxID=913 RepID=A0A4Y3WGT7_NITWI|nr:hypothetical protein NWI01_32120 [Nitrobacter winogradskyi]
MEGTRLRGGGRLCRERPESFLVPREGSALSNDPGGSFKRTPGKDPIEVLKT